MYEHNGMETPSGRLFRKLTVSKQKHWQQLYLLILISGFTWFSKRIISVHKCYARITFLSDTRSGASLLRYESSLFNLEVSQHGSNAFYPVKKFGAWMSTAIQQDKQTLIASLEAMPGRRDNNVHATQNLSIDQQLENQECRTFNVSQDELLKLEDDELYLSRKALQFALTAPLECVMGRHEGKLLLAALRWHSFHSIMTLTSMIKYMNWRLTNDNRSLPSFCSEQNLCFWRGFARAIPYLGSLSMPQEWQSVRLILDTGIVYSPDQLEQYFQFNKQKIPNLLETHSKMNQTNMSLLALLSSQAGILWEKRWVLEHVELSYSSSENGCKTYNRNGSLSDYLGSSHMSIDLHYNFTGLPCSLSTMWPPEGKGEKDNPQMVFILQDVILLASKLLPPRERIYLGFKLSQLLRLGYESRSLIGVSRIHARPRQQIGIVIDGTFEIANLPQYILDDANETQIKFLLLNCSRCSFQTASSVPRTGRYTYELLDLESDLISAVRQLQRLRQYSFDMVIFTSLSQCAFHSLLLRYVRVSPYQIDLSLDTLSLKDISTARVCLGQGLQVDYMLDLSSESNQSSDFVLEASEFSWVWEMCSSPQILSDRQLQTIVENSRKINSGSEMQADQLYQCEPKSNEDPNNPRRSVQAAKLHWVTVATHDHPNLRLMQQVSKYLGFSDITVLGMNSSLTLFDKSKCLSNQFGLCATNDKLKLVYDHIRNLPPDDIVLFTDAYDVLPLQGPDALLTKFKMFDADIVFNAEIVCFPYKNYIGYYPTGQEQLEILKKKNSTNVFVDSLGQTIRYEFLNSGIYIGKQRFLMNVFNAAPHFRSERQWCDQFYFHTVYLSLLNRTSELLSDSNMGNFSKESIRKISYMSEIGSEDSRLRFQLDVSAAMFLTATGLTEYMDSISCQEALRSNHFLSEMEICAMREEINDLGLDIPNGDSCRLLKSKTGSLPVFVHANGAQKMAVIDAVHQSIFCPRSNYTSTLCR